MLFIFYPEDGSSRFLRNIGIFLPDCALTKKYFSPAYYNYEEIL
jgi:hypothetical protein